jgi:hypothetical protein
MTRTFLIIEQRGRGQVAACAHYFLSPCIVAVALGLAGVAHAQEPVNPDPPPLLLAPPALPAPPTPSMEAPLPPPQQGISATRTTPDGKSSTAALAWSVLGTAAGFGIMVVGDKIDSDALSVVGLATTVVGPSFGHFYAGEPGRALTQSAVRAGSVGAIFAGGILLFTQCLPLFGEDECDPGPGPAILIATGVVAGASSAFYSMYDAPRAARRQNARARRLVLAPAPVVGPGQSSGFGLHLGARF